MSPALQRFLDDFGNRPAFVIGRRWDILAWNDAGCAVYGDYRSRTPRERNTVWNVFTNPLSRDFIVDWEADARQILAQFRNTCARYAGDPQLTELIHDLQLNSPEFRAWWPDHALLSGQEGRKTLNHPQVGHLHLERLTFQVFDTPDLKVTVYTPLDEGDTPRKLQELLDLWHQGEGRGKLSFSEFQRSIQSPQSEGDTVGLWIAACCKRAEGAWTANSSIMTSYINWCSAQGYEPKKAKGVSQSLASHGFEIGVNKRVLDEHHRQKMTRGVRGLVIL